MTELHKSSSKLNQKPKKNKAEQKGKKKKKVIENGAERTARIIKVTLEFQPARITREKI